MADNVQDTEETFDLDALIAEMAENEEEVVISTIEGGVSEAKSKSGLLA